MRRFLLQVGIFSGIQLAVFLALAIKYGADPQNYYAAVNLKRDQLEAPGKNRIILIGGSNTAFGIDSTRISKTMGRPCINMALHAGIGLEFMLREVEPYVREDDWVVVSPEYEHFVGDQTSWDQVILPVMEQRPSLVLLLSPRQLKLLGDTGLGYVGSRARQWFRYACGHKQRRTGAPYTRSSFNESGDVVGHHNLSPVESRNRKLSFPPVPEKAHFADVIKQLNRFASRNQLKGAHTYFSFAPIPKPSYGESKQALDSLEQRLRSELLFPVINNIEQMVMPIESFFDSNYHLTAEGKAQRTRLLVEGLESASRTVEPHQP